MLDHAIRSGQVEPRDAKVECLVTRSDPHLHYYRGPVMHAHTYQPTCVIHIHVQQVNCYRTEMFHTDSSAGDALDAVYTLPTDTLDGLPELTPTNPRL